MYSLRVVNSANIVEIEESSDDLEYIMEQAKMYLEDYGPDGATVAVWVTGQGEP